MSHLLDAPIENRQYLSSLTLLNNNTVHMSTLM